jgi:hypothetical protein
MPPGVGVPGLESDGGDQFFCGGGSSSGKVRTVRRPKRDSAAGGGSESPSTPRASNRHGLNGLGSPKPCAKSQATRSATTERP